MNWIILGQEEKREEENIFLLNLRKSDHIRNILKKQEPGNRLRALEIGKGRGEIEILPPDDTKSERIKVHFHRQSPDTPNPPTSISIFMPLPRPQTGKKILHLCGAYGVSSLLLYAHNHNKEYITSPLYKGDGWIQEWHSGLEQSGSFEDLNFQIITKSPNWKERDELQTLSSKTLNLCFHPHSRETLTSLNNSITKNSNFKLEKINLFLGSESGFQERELDQLKDLPNLHFLNLGDRILRTEFALNSILFSLEDKR